MCLETPSPKQGFDSTPIQGTEQLKTQHTEPKRHGSVSVLAGSPTTSTFKINVGRL